MMVRISIFFDQAKLYTPDLAIFVSQVHGEKE